MAGCFSKSHLGGLNESFHVFSTQSGESMRGDTFHNYMVFHGLKGKRRISGVFRCVRQERISIRGSVRRSVGPSVRPSVRMSVTQVQKPRFLAVFSHGEILY